MYGMMLCINNNKKNPKSRMLSVEESNAMLEKEFAQQSSKAEESPLKEGESKALDESMQTVELGSFSERTQPSAVTRTRR